MIDGRSLAAYVGSRLIALLFVAALLGGGFVALAILGANLFWGL